MNMLFFALSKWTKTGLISARRFGDFPVMRLAFLNIPENDWLRSSAVSGETARICNRPADLNIPEEILAKIVVSGQTSMQAPFRGR